jgi:hypothetical protein
MHGSKIVYGREIAATIGNVGRKRVTMVVVHNRPHFAASNSYYQVIMMIMHRWDARMINPGSVDENHLSGTWLCSAQRPDNTDTARVGKQCRKARRSCGILREVWPKQNETGLTPILHRDGNKLLPVFSSPENIEKMPEQCKETRNVKKE